MPEAALEIRTLLQLGTPVPAGFATRVAAALGLPAGSLDGLAGLPVREFHRDAICGGLALRMSEGRHRAAATVPMPFQSALAGVMLAAAVVAKAAGLDRPRRFADRVDLLRPLPARIWDPMSKDGTGRCLCADKHFLARYREKYPTPAARPL